MDQPNPIPFQPPHQHSITPLLVFSISLTTLILGGLVGYILGSNKITPNPLPTNILTPTLPPSITSSDSDVSRNSIPKSDRFTLNLPTDWVIEEESYNSTDVVNYFINPKKIAEELKTAPGDSGYSMVQLTVTPRTTYFTARNLPIETDLGEYITSDTTFKSNVKPTTLSGFPAYEYIDGGLRVYYTIATEHSGYIYTLIFPNLSAKSELSTEQIQILNSFTIAP